MIEVLFLNAIIKRFKCNTGGMADEGWCSRAGNVAKIHIYLSIYLSIRHSMCFQEQSNYTVYGADLSLGEETASFI